MKVTIVALVLVFILLGQAVNGQNDELPQDELLELLPDSGEVDEESAETSDKGLAEKKTLVTENAMNITIENVMNNTVEVRTNATENITQSPLNKLNATTSKRSSNSRLTGVFLNGDNITEHFNYISVTTSNPILNLTIIGVCTLAVGTLLYICCFHKETANVDIEKAEKNSVKWERSSGSKRKNPSRRGLVHKRRQKSITLPIRNGKETSSKMVVKETSDENVMREASPKVSTMKSISQIDKSDRHPTAKHQTPDFDIELKNSTIPLKNCKSDEEKKAGEGEKAGVEEKTGEGEKAGVEEKTGEEQKAGKEEKAGEEEKSKKKEKKDKSTKNVIEEEKSAKKEETKVSAKKEEEKEKSEEMNREKPAKKKEKEDPQHKEVAYDGKEAENEEENEPKKEEPKKK